MRRIFRQIEYLNIFFFPFFYLPLKKFTVMKWGVIRYNKYPIIYFPTIW